MEKLLLDGNRITELPPGVFAGLPQLRTLWVSYNQLTGITADAFAGLPHLDLLSLAANQLSSLPPNAFADLPALKKLHLWENELTALPPGLFADMPGLTLLRLDHNQLTGAADRQSSTGCRTWNSLWVSWNRIEALPPTVFQELSKLESLRLNANRIAALPPGVFDGLSDLDRLHLQYNRIPELPPGVFDDLSNLTRLDLSINRLAELPREFFRALPRLGELHLDSNPGAPFPVALELDRSDTPDVLAPGPAQVVVRAPGGFPAALRLPVSVQRGTLSRAALDLPAGNTVSEAAEVRRTPIGCRSVGPRSGWWSQDAFPIRTGTCCRTRWRQAPGASRPPGWRGANWCSSRWPRARWSSRSRPWIPRGCGPRSRCP